MDREYGNVFVDWVVENLSRCALHDGCDRGVRGGVDLDPRGEIRRNGVSSQKAKKDSNASRLTDRRRLR